MSSKEWLTIEDWLECTLPLCALQIKHEGRLERSDEDCLHVCFSSSKVGGKVLTDGMAQVRVGSIGLSSVADCAVVGMPHSIHNSGNPTCDAKRRSLGGQRSAYDRESEACRSNRQPQT